MEMQYDGIINHIGVSISRSSQQNEKTFHLKVNDVNKGVFGVVSDIIRSITQLCTTLINHCNPCASMLIWDLFYT